MHALPAGIVRAQRTQRIDLNLLIALDALLRERHVTRAARRIHLSQPAMSSALSKLRDHLGDPLLVMVGREFQMTQLAESLVEPLTDALWHVRAALTTKPSFDPAKAQRDFTAMLPDFILPTLMPRLVRAIVEQAPGIRLQLRSWTQNGPDEVQRARVDFFVAPNSPSLFGLRQFPAAFRNADLHAIRWVCAVADDHPTVGESLSRAEFLSLPHIYVRTPGDLHPLDTAVHRQLRVQLDVRVTTESVMEVPFLLGRSTLVAILPEHVALQLATSAAIRIVSLPSGILPERRVHLFWHRRNDADLGHSWMRSLLTNSATADRPGTTIIEGAALR